MTPNKPFEKLLNDLGPVHGSDAQREQKKNYAEQLSRGIASVISDQLRPRYPKARITPSKDGTNQEFQMGSVFDAKKTDVAVWDDRAGLVLGLSIKTITARDSKTQRYTKNVLRNDMELRDEADKLHRRQPFSFLVAIIFMPEDSTWDGRNKEPKSSFAHAVFSFRKRAGRNIEDQTRFDLFERVYIGLIRSDNSVAFFDVTKPPRTNQPPSGLIDLDTLLDDLEAAVEIRHLGVEMTYDQDDPSWIPPSI